MKRKRSRLSKTEYVRLLRQRAEEEAQARTESADRQERIKILWRELQKKSGRAKELAKDGFRRDSARARRVTKG
jgi:hypothetical protein